MSQAVLALDHAAKLSIKTKSPSGMREVAIGWLALASSLSDANEEQDGEYMDISDASDEYQIGFRPNPQPEELDEFDDEEEENYEPDYKTGRVIHVKRI